MSPKLPEFELLLFSVDEKKVKEAVDAGVDGVIVDWENQGKKSRQQNFDTQINYDTYEDLCRIRQSVPAGRLVCRVNGFNSDTTFAEIDRAVQGGADEIFLPMVTSGKEVRSVLSHVAGEVGVSIFIETTDSLTCLDELAQFPIKRVYVGLNDLHIQQNSRNIFVPLIDGTIKKIASSFSAPLGVGGVTHPAYGRPIASKHLIGEYARLGVRFSFLRRTFLRNSDTLPADAIFHNIRDCYREALLRGAGQVAEDRDAFVYKATEWVPNSNYP